MRILFSKTDALGDQLWATGTVARVLEAQPDAVVFWLVRQGYEAVHIALRGSRVFQADSTGSAEEEARLLLKVAASLGDEPWSRAIFVPIPLNAYSPHPAGRDIRTDAAWWMHFVRALKPDSSVAGTVTLNWVDQALVFASAAPQRVGYDMCVDAQPLPEFVESALNTEGASASFTQTFKHLAGRHEIDSLGEFARAIVQQPGYREIRLGRRPTTRKAAANAPAIVLAPGAGDPARIYSLPKLAAAISRLDPHKRSPNPVAILQGPRDADVCVQLVSELQAQGVASRIVDAAGPRLSEAIRLLEECVLLVCNESFWAHLASALATPTVAIWGLGHWQRFTPCQGRITVLHSDLLCQQCNWLCCFTARHCITEIPSDALVAAAQERIADTTGKLGIRYVPIPSRRTPESVRQALYEQTRRALQTVDERNLLHAQLTDLQRNFNGVEADRIARGNVIEDQGRQIGLLHADMDARLKELSALSSRLSERENERNLLQAQLADLQRNFDGAEADRIARGNVIEDQGRTIGRLHADIDARLKELATLSARSSSLENERNLLQAQLADLKQNFDGAEADRIARGNVIEDQGRTIGRLHADIDARLKELATLSARSSSLENERNLLQAQLADLKQNFDGAEADRIARGSVIDDQGRTIGRLHADIDARLKELATLSARSSSLENERNLLQAQLADLKQNFDGAEADRIARGNVIEDQGQKITLLHAELASRLQELTALSAHSSALENECDLLANKSAHLKSELIITQAERDGWKRFYSTLQDHWAWRWHLARPNIRPPSTSSSNLPAE